uniref:Fibronectin type-III domain-containing protein n=1 Tax=Echinostoma caproni TaxID=27848 RepID=A0A183A175_9TREM
LRPDDTRQFLFRLTPTASLLQMHTVKSIAADASKATSAPLRPIGPQPSQPIQQPPISAGRLDITWRETMGERGRLQTSSLKYEACV